MKIKPKNEIHSRSFIMKSTLFLEKSKNTQSFNLGLENLIGRKPLVASNLTKLALLAPSSWFLKEIEILCSLPWSSLKNLGRGKERDKRTPKSWSVVSKSPTTWFPSSTLLEFLKKLEALMLALISHGGSWEREEGRKKKKKKRRRRRERGNESNVREFWPPLGSVK